MYRRVGLSKVIEEIGRRRGKRGERREERSKRGDEGEEMKEEANHILTFM